ncbi:hypothetical protein ACQPZG_32100 [Streptomyces sp. CA-294286]|uniref:hypothetical protein n=1 Tax=Streptomyces sp. CA-294286 TaxID=3240070 RepID=UPI003D8DFCD8
MLNHTLTPLPLEPRHLQLLALRADGHSMARSAATLRRTPATLYNHASECNRRLGVPTVEAAVHVCYLAQLLPRPDLAEFTLDLGWEDLELWRLLATGATTAHLSHALDLSVSTITLRTKDLRQRTLCTSRPQLVSRGWSHGVLHDSLVRMASGRTVLLPPVPPAGGTPFVWAPQAIPAGSSS